MMKIIATGAIIAASAAAHAQTATFLGTWSGNGHSYYVVNDFTTTWTDAAARAAAFGPTLSTPQTSYLVTITSAAEQAFLNGVVYVGPTPPTYWMGLDKAANPSGNNWAWITGESTAYTNWAGDADFTNPGLPYGSFNWGPTGIWLPLANDGTPFGLKRYVIEVVPAPGSVALLGLGAFVAGRRRR